MKYALIIIMFFLCKSYSQQKCLCNCTIDTNLIFNSTIDVKYIYDETYAFKNNNKNGDLLFINLPSGGESRMEVLRIYEQNDEIVAFYKTFETLINIKINNAKSLFLQLHKGIKSGEYFYFCNFISGCESSIICYKNSGIFYSLFTNTCLSKICVLTKNENIVNPNLFLIYKMGMQEIYKQLRKSR